MSTPTQDTDRLPVAGGAATWRAVRTTLGLSRVRLAAGVVLLVAASLAGFVAPWALGQLVDVVAADPRDSAVYRLVVVMVAGGLAGGVLNGWAYTVTSRVMETSLARLREQMVDEALGLAWPVVERAGTGDLVSRASDDVRQVASAGPRVVTALSTAFLTILLTFAVMAGVNPFFALALAVILPVHVVTVRWYLRRVPQLYVAERVAVAESSRALLSSLRGHDTVLAYRRGDYHADLVARTSWDTAQWSIAARRMVNRFFGRLNFAEFLGMSALLVVGYLLVDAGRATVGEATAAMLFFLRLFNPINMLLFVVDDMQSAAASLARIVGVIDLGRASRESAPVVAAGEPAAVDLTDVTFHYPGGPDVLHRIDLSLAAGEHVALVGTTGAGKSTLAGLVCGLHRPVAGIVEVHGPDGPVAPVLLTQESHVFNATLRENLTLARPEARDEEILRACASVRADSMLVDALADGLDTAVGAGGHRLTGPQEQLLALARLALCDPAVAVLDEATAEAGSAAAGHLDEAAAAALRGRTALVVAHRLSQAARTDRIVVMEHGRIVEQGSHDDLVASDGRYARLWEAWTRHGARH